MQTLASKYYYKPIMSSKRSYCHASPLPYMETRSKKKNVNEPVKQRKPRRKCINHQWTYARQKWTMENTYISQGHCRNSTTNNFFSCYLEPISGQLGTKSPVYNGGIGQGQNWWPTVLEIENFMLPMGRLSMTLKVPWVFFF